MNRFTRSVIAEWSTLDRTYESGVEFFADPPVFPAVTPTNSHDLFRF